MRRLLILKWILFIIFPLVTESLAWSRPSPNPFIHHEGFYRIQNAEICIQNDFPVHCPWEEVEVRTNRQVTCLKFKVESSVQHYCFESLDQPLEKANYSTPEGAQWDYQIIHSNSGRTMKQVSLQTKGENSTLLKIEEYSWQEDRFGERFVRIDIKIHLAMTKVSF